MGCVVALPFAFITASAAFFVLMPPTTLLCTSFMASFCAFSSAAFWSAFRSPVSGSLLSLRNFSSTDLRTSLRAFFTSAIFSAEGLPLAATAGGCVVPLSLSPGVPPAGGCVVPLSLSPGVPPAGGCVVPLSLSPGVPPAGGCVVPLSLSCVCSCVLGIKPERSMPSASPTIFRIMLSRSPVPFFSPSGILLPLPFFFRSSSSLPRPSLFLACALATASCSARISASLASLASPLGISLLAFSKSLVSLAFFCSSDLSTVFAPEMASSTVPLPAA